MTVDKDTAERWAREDEEKRIRRWNDTSTLNDIRVFGEILLFVAGVWLMFAIPLFALMALVDWLT